jgi:hypothetical protein
LALDFTGYAGLLEKLVTRRGVSSIVHAWPIQVVGAQFLAGGAWYNRHVNQNKLPVVVLAVSLTGETLLSARHSDTLAPQPHTDVQITEPIATTVSSISASGGASGAATALDWDDTGAWPIRMPYASHLNQRAVAQILSHDEAIGAPHEMNAEREAGK